MTKKIATPKARGFKRVLIANRGEIAVRVARTLREMGITPIGVYSDVDRPAPHVRACEMAFPVGSAPAVESYLRGETLIEVAKKARADAIHPGYGFLSESPEFAQAVVDAGLVFIGPSPTAMRVMGSKTEAREAVTAAGVPCVPGTAGIESSEQAREAARGLGFPVLLKASAGGGGKGMRLIERDDEVEAAFRAARSEAKSAFGSDAVYLEKAILSPRHIEIQILGGPDGKAIYLGERECSMQRRHQKIIEESPSAAVDEKLRAKMGEVACRAVEAVGYAGAGTVEFLLDADYRFYFLETNTRLQVEHPVTEMCCGIDMVEAQVRIAEGDPLPWQQEEVACRGHAIEARVYAEDPARNFLPSPGKIADLVLPHGPGVRVDSGVASGFEVPRFYDPMIAKVIAWAEDRDRARRRLLRALGETVVKGITTNTAFLRALLDSEAFCRGAYHTGTVGELLAAVGDPPPAEVIEKAICAMAVAQYQRDSRRARDQISEVASTQEGHWRRVPAWRWGEWR